jgi:hypothetical protein
VVVVTTEDRTEWDAGYAAAVARLEQVSTPGSWLADFFQGAVVEPKSTAATPEPPVAAPRLPAPNPAQGAGGLGVHYSPGEMLGDLVRERIRSTPMKWS